MSTRYIRKMRNRKPNAMKMARLACGMDLRDVAHVTGFSKSAISSWEQKTRTPQLASLRRLARVYGVRVKDLSVDSVHNRR